MDDPVALSTIIPSTIAALDQVAAIANQVAASHALDEYHAGLAHETLRRQGADLALFTRYLHSVGTQADDFFNNLEAWRSISYGIVEGFKRWQQLAGYAVGSINVRLATIKAYCKLAHDAGLLTTETYTRIQGVKGYRRDHARNIDEKREKTRIGPKKAVHVSISPTHMELLKHPHTGDLSARDALLMCLLLDHGLRVGEVAGLHRSSIDLQGATLTFYRHKVDKTQIHKLTTDTLQASQLYLAAIPAAQDSLFDNLTTRAINKRVRVLGKRVGLVGLSPHDCRHAWATDAARNKTDILSLQQAGGWNSMEMPARYVEANAIANEGVILTSARRERKGYGIE
jgi:integrase